MQMARPIINDHYFLLTKSLHVLMDNTLGYNTHTIGSRKVNTFEGWQAPQMCFLGGNRNVLRTLSKVHNPLPGFTEGLGFRRWREPFTRSLHTAVTGSHDIWSVGMTRVWQRRGRHRLHSHVASRRGSPSASTPVSPSNHYLL